MRSDYVYRYWDNLGNNGFKRLFNEGFSFTNAHFNYMLTSTGFGHTSINAGTTPSVYGIMVKKWFVPLNQYRSLVERPNEFLLISGIEITDRHADHLLAFHIDKVIPTVGGNENEKERMINDTVELVNDYKIRSSRNTYPVLAHPNWNWAITAEMIANAEKLRFFEVYNGVPESNNTGDKLHPGTDRIWDIALSLRLQNSDSKLLYGIAADDAHDYDGGIDGRNVGPGKGWIMVRSDTLSEKSILNALDNGDFYSSTGVAINDFEFDGKRLTVEIKPEKGIEYRTMFIGTRLGFDDSNRARLDEAGIEIQNTTKVYSEEVGEVLKQSNNISSSYTLRGDELYVRVLIVSSADHLDPMTGEELGVQKAWLQPVTGKHFN